MLKRWLIALAPVVALCATMAASTGSASASTNVVQAITQQNSVISGNSLQRVLKLEQTDKKNPTKLYHALDKVAGQLAHAATVVSRSSAIDAHQREGRHDWTTGVRDLSKAYYKLGHAYHEIAQHHESASTFKLIGSAQKMAETGEKDVQKAVHLLS